MIREWAASLATLLGHAALWRSRVWSRRSKFFADVSEWLDTSESWDVIRARRGRPDDETAEASR